MSIKQLFDEQTVVEALRCVLKLEVALWSSAKSAGRRRRAVGAL